MAGRTKTFFHHLMVILASLIAFSSSASACLDTNDEGFASLSSFCRQDSAIDGFLKILISERAKPRKIAILAGVSVYAELSESQQLEPVDHDLAILERLYREKLDFDEIITIKNGDFNLQTLTYLFQNYLPGALKRNPKSQVVFAFSGHGADFDDNGYVFTDKTSTIEINDFSDTRNAIELNLLKSIMAPTIKGSHHFLAMINSCNGGHFLNLGVRAFGTALNEKGAHAITAGGANEIVYARDNVGSGKGSVFFEMVNAAFSGEDTVLQGRQFSDPANDDGILTADELAVFLTSTIRFIEKQQVTPRSNRIIPPAPGEQGQIFFVVDKDKAVAAMHEQFPANTGRWFGEVDTRDNDRPIRILPPRPDDDDGHRPNSEDEGLFSVFIRGQVRNEGKYSVRAGTRVEDLIELAGGLTDSVNDDDIRIDRYKIDDDGQMNHSVMSAHKTTFLKPLDEIRVPDDRPKIILPPARPTW